MKSFLSCLLVVGLQFLVSCASVKTADSIVEQTKNIETPQERISLYWENTTERHDERIAWSDEEIRILDRDFAVFDSAKDIDFFCPKYSSLSRRSKLKAWGELRVATAYYESSFDPKSASVDVGKKTDKDTWSVGLYQISVVDQESYNLPMGFVYDDLLKPIPNIQLSLAILKRQIAKRGLIVVPSSPYWAVLYRGKYDKIDSIKQRVLKYAPDCK